MPKKLPIGIQDFKKIINGNYIYVDKTKYLFDLIKQGTPVFLSRPRRFGKSLTLSTLYYLFSGKKELFKGLYIHDKWDFKKYPVIRLDMSATYSTGSIEEFKQSVHDLITSEAKKHNLNIKKRIISSLFKEIIEELSKVEKVVVLIDEYDKPILDNITNVKKAQKVREVLRSCYDILKPTDQYLKHVFLTGISKFSKVGVFSTLNHLRDISLSSEYSEFLGLTEKEIKKYFKKNLQKTSKIMNKSQFELLDKIKDWYNGFSFDGNHFVYNPFSILIMFAENEFRNYWYETGTPSFLVKLVKKKKIDNVNIREKIVDIDFTNKKEIEKASPESFLFQAGYLTIKKSMSRYYKLDYPNNEVKNAFATLFLDNIYNVEDAPEIKHNLEIAFDKNDFENVFQEFQKTFSMIPYNLFSKNESFYHAVLLTLLWAAGIDAKAEEMTNLGRRDIVIRHKDIIYILELKKGKNALKKALEQIKEKNYYKKYSGKKMYLIGISIDEKKRNLMDFLQKSI
ncbi:AAA family ATPase [Candidatus Woesearchaeota archaeon]|nr:AAA family ATPase [Candidatus Woesearchaeota archaeon]